MSSSLRRMYSIDAETIEVEKVDNGGGVWLDLGGSSLGYGVSDYDFLVRLDESQVLELYNKLRETWTT